MRRNNVLRWAARLLLIASAVATSLGVRPAKARDLLILEWADEGRDRKTIRNDPVFKRVLYCEAGQGVINCDMLVLMIGRQFCPLIAEQLHYQSEAGNLRAVRRGDTLDIEIDDTKANTKLRLTLKTDLIKQKIVDQASGAMVFKPHGEEAVRTAELVPITRTSKGMENYPETAEVELNCSKLAVTAAKRAAK